MKTKTIVTAMLLGIAGMLLVNLMSISGMYQDETVVVGWYDRFRGNRTTTLNAVYVWLNLPFSVCFYLFATLFFAKIKTHVNKWLGGAAFALWCINLLCVVLDIVPSLYIAANFSGDEMYRPLEDYWETVGMSDYPLLWFLLSEGSMGGTLYFLQYYGYWICPLSYLGFAVTFALLVKKNKVLGTTGATVMAISFLSYLLYQLPYVYIAYNFGWIALCAVVLRCLRRSSPHKPFVLS